jgi:hypothetical protein
VLGGGVSVAGASASVGSLIGADGFTAGLVRRAVFFFDVGRAVFLAGFFVRFAVGMMVLLLLECGAWLNWMTVTNRVECGFERKVKPQMKGYVRLIRYADDLVVCIQSEKEAHAFVEMLKERLAKFGLRLSENKSRIIAFGRYVWQKAQREGQKVETFDFLGFTHYCDKTRKGAFKLGRRTARKKFRQKVKEMNEWLKRIRNGVKLTEWWRVLGQKLMGHYRYYGVSGNYPSLRRFYRLAFKMAYKWIQRRSQKGW